MRYFIDTEFVFETEYNQTKIQPISIAIVAEDGRELYFYDLHFDFPRDVRTRLFLAEHVVPVIRKHHPSIEPCPAPARWADEIRRFIGSDWPEFWGDYAAFDYVVLSSIMGGFDHWMAVWPKYINDCQQAGILPNESAIPHNALSDARAIRDAVLSAMPPEPAE